MKSDAPGAAHATVALVWRARSFWQAFGEIHVFARDRQDRLREGLRHARLRLPRPASRRSVQLQRGDDRRSTARSRRPLPRRTISRASGPSSTSGGATRQHAGRDPGPLSRSRAACCSICRTSCATRRSSSSARGVADRVRIEGGSFFERVPAGGDAYVLSHIIHDWNEEQCLTILGNCRKAMKPEASLLIVEMVLPDRRQAAPRQDARHDDARAARRPGADRCRIRGTCSAKPGSA